MRNDLNYHIKKQINKVYTKQKLGDCYEINSTVAYFLGELNYNFRIVQGKVKLDRKINDNKITDYTDHIWIELRGISQIRLDYADKVFLPAKIQYYGRNVSSMWGKENKKLMKLLRSDKNIIKKYKIKEVKDEFYKL